MEFNYGVFLCGKVDSRSSFICE